MSDDVVRIEALAAILRAYDLDTLEVRIGEATYKLVRRASVAAPIAPLAGGSAVAPSVVAAPPAAAAPPPSVKRIVAPINGIFYRSLSPGAQPFVEIGDRVEVGQVVCILEAMKNMNEITSDAAGVVKRILAENGELVARDGEMFWIEP